MVTIPTFIKYAIILLVILDINLSVNPSHHKKMATKSTTPSIDQLEIDQLAEAEVERLKKQVIDICQSRHFFQN